MTSIRRYTLEDKGAIQRLITQIMHEEFTDEMSAYPMEDIDHIEKAYQGLGDAFFVATDGAAIIGTVAIKKEDDRVALLRRLFVAKPYRKQQFGLKLIDRAIQFCDEMGYEELIFRTTSKMQAAAKLCQKKGFVPRAKLALGPVELLKFALSIRNAVKGAR